MDAKNKKILENNLTALGITPTEKQMQLTEDLNRYGRLHMLDRMAADDVGLEFPAHDGMAIF